MVKMRQCYFFLLKGSINIPKHSRHNNFLVKFFIHNFYCSSHFNFFVNSVVFINIEEINLYLRFFLFWSNLTRRKKYLQIHDVRGTSRTLIYIYIYIYRELMIKFILMHPRCLRVKLSWTKISLIIYICKMAEMKK